MYSAHGTGRDRKGEAMPDDPATLANEELRVLHAQGRIRAVPPEGGWHLWAGIHGLASLFVDGALPSSPAFVDHALGHVMHGLIHGLEPTGG
jgi:hypothetical protein